MTGPILLRPQSGWKIDAPRMIDWGGSLTPPNGGAVQTLSRLGTRHALDVTPPAIKAEPEGRIFSAQLRLAKLFGALIPFDQDGFKPGLCGRPVVSDSGQSGMTLALRSFTPNYSVRMGQAFSLVHQGRRYLHFVASQGVANSTGVLALSIFPMLRVIPDANSVCEFTRPMIEGSLSGNEVAWTRQTAGYFDFGTITISEDR